MHIGTNDNKFHKNRTSQALSLEVSLLPLGGAFSQPLWSDDLVREKGTLFWKASHAMNNHAIVIARAINATKTTSRLNLRIRLSYACNQLPRGEVRFGPPTNPLAFTNLFYHN